jgi:hypothetical protein
MPYCSKCGVEVDDGVESCPLCGLPIQRFDEGGRPVFKPWPDQVINPDSAVLPLRERVKMALEVATVFLGVSLAVLLLIDLLLDRGFSWSVYPAAAIVYLWLCLSMPVFLYGRPWLVFSVLGPATIVFVFLMDAFDGRITWFLPYGLPVTVLAVGVLVAVAVLSVTAKRKGLNVAAFVFFGIAVLCAGIDAIVKLNETGLFGLSWSVIVAFVLIPASLLLLYLHVRITKRVDLKKVFHL